MAGSGWPERHRRRSDLLRTCHRHQVGTARPKARSDRTKWPRGYPARHGICARSLHLPTGRRTAVRTSLFVETLNITNVLHTRAVPGGHGAIPNGLGGAPHAPPSTPTDDGRFRVISRRGKRVTVTVEARPRVVVRVVAIRNGIISIVEAMRRRQE